MSPPIPPDAYAMIVGAMKSGTTSLFDYLSGHPQICPAHVKEPEYFSENQRHRTNVQSYEELWEFDVTVHRYALEASTGYTKYPLETNIPQKIRDYGLKPKFIYVLRNPFERIESHFNFFAGDDTWTEEITSPRLIGISNYFLQLQQFESYFPKQSFLLLDFQELKENPQASLRRVFAHLKIDESYSPAEFKTENRTVIMSHSEKAIRTWGMNALYPYIPKAIKRPVRDFLRRVNAPAKRSLTETERQLIADQLSAGMQRLSDEYGFDVSQWGFGT